MKKWWTGAVGLFLVVLFFALLSNNFDVNVGKYNSTSQFASTPPIKPPPVPKS